MHTEFNFSEFCNFVDELTVTHNWVGVNFRSSKLAEFCHSWPPFEPRFICPGCKGVIRRSHYEYGSEARTALVAIEFYRHKHYSTRIAHRSCFPRTIAFFAHHIGADSHSRLLVLQELKNAGLIKPRKQKHEV